MTARKTPQDRKPKTSTAWADIDGSELLKPFAQVKGSDQIRLMSKLKSLGLMSDDEDRELDLEAAADLIDWIAEKFAVSTGAFEDFTSGPGGFQRALDLATAYASLLGESDSSTS